MKLVIFDFDGVLVDTLGIVYSIHQECDDNLSLEEFKSYFNGNFFETKKPDGTPKKMHSDFKGSYDLKSRNIVIPDILKLVVKKLSQNYLLAIVSSTYTESIKKILIRDGVLDCFKEILGADVNRDKVIKTNSVLEKYNILPKDTVFITDTLGDIKEAEKCGVKSIAVVWGFHDKKTLEAGNPVAIIDNPADLLSAIESMLK